MLLNQPLSKFLRIFIIIFTQLIVVIVHASSFEDDFYDGDESASSTVNKVSSDGNNDNNEIVPESSSEVRYPRYRKIALKKRPPLVQIGYDLAMMTYSQPLLEESQTLYGHQFNFTSYSPISSRFYFFYGLSLGFISDSLTPSSTTINGVITNLQGGIGLQLNRNEVAPFLLNIGMIYSPYSTWNDKREDEAGEDLVDTTSFNGSGQGYFAEIGPTLSGERYNFYIRLGYRHVTHNLKQEGNEELFFFQNNEFAASSIYLHLGFLTLF